MVTSSQQTSIVSRYTCIIYSFHIILLLCAVWRYAYAHCTRVAGVLEEEHLYWVSFENANALNAKILTLWYDIKACQRVREILLNASILIECVSLAVFYLIFFLFFDKQTFNAVYVYKFGLSEPFPKQFPPNNCAALLKYNVNSSVHHRNAAYLDPAKRDWFFSSHSSLPHTHTQ